MALNSPDCDFNGSVGFSPCIVLCLLVTEFVFGAAIEGILFKLVAYIFWVGFSMQTPVIKNCALSDGGVIVMALSPISLIRVNILE